MTLFLHDLLFNTRVQFLLLLLLLLLEYLSVVVVKKAITFSSKIFQTLCFYLFFCSCCCYFNALGIPLSSSQLPPIRVIREPLDLFHFVGLPALLFHLLSLGEGKLDCSKNKLLIKQIDTRTISFLSTKGDFAHTLAHGLDDEILLHSTHNTTVNRE